MSNPLGLISWQTLQEGYIDPAVPIEQILCNSPEVRLIYDPSSCRLGMRLSLAPGRQWAPAAALSNVMVRLVLVSGRRYVEVHTDSRDLFRAIYLLVSDVYSRLADGESDSLRALEQSLDDFEALVAKTGQLSRQAAIGLFGELWTLHSLLSDGAHGPECWIGADKELHDFRVGTFELEIKTTNSNVRRHCIHGLNQLSPTPGHELEIVSIRLTLAGSDSGHSVCSLAEEIKALLQGDELALREFSRCLRASGFNEEHAECLTLYRLATAPKVIAIGSEFPALSYEWLSSSIGSEPAARIRNVDLTLDLEGIGRTFDASRYRT